MAFLSGYGGDLRAAYRHYRAAERIPVDASVLHRVEDFLCWMLTEEPDKHQLHYCLALFNRHVKGDKTQAIQDFEAFLGSGCPERFAKERELAARWVEDLRAGMEA